MPRLPIPVAVDDLLGRSYLFHSDGYTVNGSITIIAHDPDKGWQLDGGPAYAPAWISDAMFLHLLKEGVLS